MHRSFITKPINRSTLRLAGSYLAIIMILSIGFSFAFYHDSARALGRQLPAPVDEGSLNYGYAFGLDRPGVNKFLAQRYVEGRGDLLHRLVFLNLLALIGGGALSLLLARKSLEPIEASMLAQSRFVSDASHELRTPLTAIRTRNEVTLRKKSLGVKEAKDTIAGNLIEIQKLENLTNGLLQLAREDSLPPKLSPVAIDKVTAQAINQVITQAQTKKITIEDKSSKDKVVAEESALAQVLTALLDNAIKYSQPGTVVTISSRAKNDDAVIEVADQGQGIRATDLPHIFNRFYRADTARSQSGYSGYGLGLSIAKKIIVDQMGGQINVRSKLGHGSTFSIKLPITR